jgi:hypothetical protein
MRIMLTNHEVAKALSVHQTTVYMRVRRGELPPMDCKQKPRGWLVETLEQFDPQLFKLIMAHLDQPKQQA